MNTSLSQTVGFRTMDFLKSLKSLASKKGDEAGKKGALPEYETTVSNTTTTTTRTTPIHYPTPSHDATASHNATPTIIVHQYTGMTGYSKDLDIPFKITEDENENNQDQKYEFQEEYDEAPTIDTEFHLQDTPSNSPPNPNPVYQYKHYHNQTFLDLTDSNQFNDKKQITRTVTFSDETNVREIPRAVTFSDETNVREIPRTVTFSDERHPRNPLEIGNKVWILSDKTHLWRECIIRDERKSDTGTDQIKIHYISFRSSFDEWIDTDSDRIACLVFI